MILAVCTATVVLTVTGVDALTAVSGLVGLMLVTGTLIETSVREQHRLRAWILLVVLVCVAGIELAIVGSSDALLSPAIVMLMGLGAAFAVTRNVLRVPYPGTTSLAASGCAYLLIGYSFASLYLLVDRATADSFLLSGEALTPESSIYFSFVTLTTLGFGDLTPAPSSGRTLVTLEAMLGQAYIAVAVARLVAGMAVGSNESDRSDQGAESGR